MDQIKIGNVIKQRRCELNLTQNELAKKINVSNKAVSKWESGNGIPDIINLKALSEVLDIKIEDLLDGNNISNVQKMDFVEKRLNEKTKLQLNFEKIVKISIILILLVMSLILILSIGKNLLPMYKGTNVLYYDGDDKDLKEADKNLEIIKNSNSSIYSSDDKKAIINFLETIKKNIYNTKEKVKKEDFDKKRNLYSAINLNYLQIETIKKEIAKEKNIDNNIFEKGREFFHTNYVFRLDKYDENIYNKYNSDYFNQLSYLIRLNNNYDVLYLTLKRKNNVLDSFDFDDTYDVIEELKYIFKDEYKIESFILNKNIDFIPLKNIDKMKIEDFKLIKLYLESTKLVMKVGNIYE